MKILVFSFLLFLILIFSSANLFAQNKTITITGTVVDSNSKEPISFATVVLRDTNSNNSITGTTTGDNGEFTLESNSQNIYVEISFIGHENWRIDSFSIINGIADLGTIFLEEISQALTEVTIMAEKSSTEFKLDKRVFNVGQDIASTGMGALEVLNRVPSVNVNIEGQISLRGSTGVKILIDGKPSVLADERSNALGTITADMIEKIEVITNPSAKYDAEGTSGILNIVLKKEDKKGLNGSISINTGIPDNHSIGLSLNRRTEKFNLFAQLGGGYRSIPNETENINRDLLQNTSVENKGEYFRNEAFYNIILGSDYYINEYNVLTLSGNFAYEIEDQPSETDFQFIDASDAITSQWHREETTEATNPKWQYELQYKKEFEDNKEHMLLFSALGSFFGKKQSSEFENQTISGTPNDSQQQTETDFQQTDYTFRLDYTKPFNDRYTIETGAQYVINDVGNDYEVQDLVNGDWVINESLTNNFEYNQKVLGLYATGAYEGDVWGFKAGLRVESTKLNTFLTNTNEKNKQDYTDFFPSAHATYKFSEKTSIQAGYSSRVYRPRLWDLNPFFNIRNNYNIRTGNPNLQPEYTDSFEIMAIFILEKASINTGFYHRYTTDVIEQVTFFRDNVTLSTPINIGINNTTGFETNLKYSPLEWFTVNGDFNFNYFIRDGDYEDQSFDFNGNSWTTKVTGKFKLPSDFDIEVTGHYLSGYPTVQSEISSTTFMDLGIRKKIIKGKAVINLGITDVFASRINERNTYQPDFYTYSRNTRGRFITLGFSYGFGKGEAMTYSGRRR